MYSDVCLLPWEDCNMRVWLQLFTFQTETAECVGAAHPNMDTILDSTPASKAVCRRFPNGAPRHPAARRFKILFNSFNLSVLFFQTAIKLLGDKQLLFESNFLINGCVRHLFGLEEGAPKKFPRHTNDAVNFGPQSVYKEQNFVLSQGTNQGCYWPSYRTQYPEKTSSLHGVNQ
jgi:hypothetical protein